MEDIESVLLEIKELLNAQRFGSLATLHKSSIHSTLVAYTVDESLQYIYFCTSSSTRKYENINTHKEVSLLVHNSTNKDQDLTVAKALTITGTARILSEEEQRKASQLLQLKHPYLKELMGSPEVVYIVIDVLQYDLVSNFQDVRTITVTGEVL